MGIRELIGECSRQHYKKLINEDEDAVRTKSSRRRVKQMNRRVTGFRISPSKRLNWRRISLFLMPRKVAGIYADIASRMRIDGGYPTIIFSSQWGLPVLSHPSLAVTPTKKSLVSVHRNISSHF